MYPSMILKQLAMTLSVRTQQNISDQKLTDKPERFHVSSIRFGDDYAVGYQNFECLVQFTEARSLISTIEDKQNHHDFKIVSILRGAQSRIVWQDLHKSVLTGRIIYQSELLASLIQNFGRSFSILLLVRPS
jgi:hypothetical protein